MVFECVRFGGSCYSHKTEAAGIGKKAWGVSDVFRRRYAIRIEIPRTDTKDSDSSFMIKVNVYLLKVHVIVCS